MKDEEEEAMSPPTTKEVDVDSPHIEVVVDLVTVDAVGAQVDVQ